MGDSTSTDPYVWEPVIGRATGLRRFLSLRPPTLQMRRKDNQWGWVFREPTPEELAAYVDNDAW